MNLPSNYYDISLEVEFYKNPTMENIVKYRKYTINSQNKSSAYISMLLLFLISRDVYSLLVSLQIIANKFSPKLIKSIRYDILELNKLHIENKL